MMVNIVEEMGNRGDFVSLKAMIDKYNHDLPIDTRLAFIKALNELAIYPSKEFLEAVLEEKDISDELMYFTLMLFINIGEIQYVIDLSLTGEGQKKKNAAEVIDDLD